MKTEILLEPRGVPAPWHSTLRETARFSRTIAVQTFEREGTRGVGLSTRQRHLPKGVSVRLVGNG